MRRTRAGTRGYLLASREALRSPAQESSSISKARCLRKICRFGDVGIQSCFFAFAQRAHLAPGKIAERKRANGDTYEPQHLDMNMRQHATDLPVLALIENDLEPGVALAAAQDSRLPGAQRVS